MLNAMSGHRSVKMDAKTGHFCKRINSDKCFLSIFDTKKFVNYVAPMTEMIIVYQSKNATCSSVVKGISK